MCRIRTFLLGCVLFGIAASVASAQGLEPLQIRPTGPTLQLPGVSPFAVLQDPSPLESLRPSYVPRGFDQRAIFALSPQSPYAVLRDPSPLYSLNPSYTTVDLSQFQTPWNQPGMAYLLPPLADVRPSPPPVDSIITSWRQLLVRFERFNTKDSWQSAFALPASLSDSHLRVEEVSATLNKMKSVDAQSKYHKVSRLPEFRRLKRQLTDYLESQKSVAKD